MNVLGKTSARTSSQWWESGDHFTGVGKMVEVDVGDE